MPIKALMVDVDGVLVDGRPQDSLHWQASLQNDLGVSAEALQKHFFAPHWDDIVLGRIGLIEPLTRSLQKIAPEVVPSVFLAYWFEHDSRIVTPLLQELSRLRSTGIRVYLATNQEHLRASWLMDQLGLAQYVDGIFYSASLGVKKPDAEFFTRVQKAVGLPSEDILLIDDSEQNTDAARRTGWRTLHWSEHSSPDMLQSLCA